MPKIKIFASLAVVVLAVALVGGATLAWFTSATDPITNVFTAGTVDIEAGYQGDLGKIVTRNWNPGDCDETNICVNNTGSKAVKIRAQLQVNGYPVARECL